MENLAYHYPDTERGISEIGFTLDLRRAAAIDNELRAQFSFEGVDKKGGPDKREEDAKIRFIAKPDRNWWDYIILMWERYPTEHVAILKTLGVNAGQSNGRSYKPPERNRNRPSTTARYRGAPARTSAQSRCRKGTSFCGPGSGNRLD